MFTVYKTVNLVTSQYYIGVHKTDNPNDQYMGSGLLVRRAIAKHGRQQFQKSVLFAFKHSERAFEKERELVHLASGDSLCYNLHEGGFGGFHYINRNGFQKMKSERAKQNMSASAKVRAQRPESQALLRANGFKALQRGTFNPGRPSDQAVEVIRQKAIGRKMSVAARKKTTENNRLRSPEFSAWCVRKRWASVKGLPFNEPKPTIYRGQNAA